MYLRKFFRLIPVMGLMAGQFSYSQQDTGLPKDLKESISRALQFSSRVNAANERIRGQEALATSLKDASYLPTLQLSTGLTVVNGEVRPDTGRPSASHNQTRFAQARLQINLFGDGAWSTAKASSKNAEAFAHSMNTLDTNLSFTKGSLIDGLIDAYAEIAQGRERLQVQLYRKYIYQLLVSKKMGEIEKFKNIISNIDAFIESNTNVAINISTEKFKNFVTMLPALEIENLDQTILAISPPKTFETAFQIALEKNPEILRRKALAEASQENYQATKRQNGVQVNADLQARYSEFNNTVANGIDNNSNTYTANIVVSKTFDRKNSGENLRAGANANAALSEIDTVVGNERVKLYASYQRLPSLRSSYQTQYKLYSEKLNLVNDAVNTIKAMDPKTSANKFDVTSFLSNVTELLNAMTEKQKAQLGLLNELVNISQATGLIFELTK